MEDRPSSPVRSRRGMTARSRIERAFRSAIMSLEISSGATLIAGVSGGPDSSALLLLLLRFAPDLGYCLEAASFDHEIRSPVERHAEQRAVRNLAAGLGVILHEGHAAVPALAKGNHRSLEEEARIQRYGFLARIAADRGATTVAVGHTADDQAETILLHLLRGSGLRGLAGMALESGWPVGAGPRLIRPLLSLCRSDTEAYCRLAGIEPYRDASNETDRYRRNRVRRELLPLMRSFNPRVVEALGRLGHAAGENLELMDRLAAAAEADALGRQACAVSVDVLRQAPAGLRVELVARAYAAAKGSRDGLASRHIAALTTLASATGEHALDLPGGIRARTTGPNLRFEPALSAAVPSAGPLPETPLRIPGLTRVGPWEVSAEHVARPPGDGQIPSTECILRVPTGAMLVVRSRRPGDRMRPAGLAGTKKLQDLFVDAHLPRSQRDEIPIVCLDGAIVWAAGVRRAEQAVTDTERGLTVRLSVRRLDSESRAD